ncbi:MAG TPA: helix-turn-helix domain-containing protein [Candidatus Mediterraneibacter norfolkensis]|nr:helix-turn-helix domain-containing protein [Candidatus Mediterraneibacter norfolkensis]
MQFYLTIEMIQTQIDRFRKDSLSDPDFGSLLKKICQQRLYSARKPELPDLTRLRREEDSFFFCGIKKLYFEFSKEMLFFKEVYDFVRPGSSLFVAKEFYGTKTFLHSHDCYEIDFILRGKCEFTFRDEKICLNEGDCCFVSPHARHSLRLSTPDSCVLPVMVKPETFKAIFSSLLESENVLSKFFKSTLFNRTEENYLLFHTNNSFEIRQAMKELFLSEFQIDQYYNPHSIYWLNLFFISILRNYRDFNTFLDCASESGYSEILNYIQRNYRTVTINELAKKFNYSPSYLSKMIRQLTGESFTSLIRTMKMTKAGDMLLNTSLSVEAISGKTGYNSADHFTRVFKKYYGMPPQKYRKEKLK